MNYNAPCAAIKDLIIDLRGSDGRDPEVDAKLLEMLGYETTRIKGGYWRWRRGRRGEGRWEVMPRPTRNVEDARRIEPAGLVGIRTTVEVNTGDDVMFTVTITTKENKSTQARHPSEAIANCIALVQAMCA